MFATGGLKSFQDAGGKPDGNNDEDRQTTIGRITTG